MAYLEQDGVLHVDGVSLLDIAKNVGSPTYVYSSDIIETQYHKLTDAMKACLPADQQPLLCFACKANYF